MIENEPLFRHSVHDKLPPITVDVASQRPGPVVAVRPSVAIRKSTAKQSVYLYTQSVPPPRFSDTIRTKRAQLRVMQLALCSCAFISLAFSAFNINYPYYVLANSGVNLMAFTNIVSLVSNQPQR